ncbi:MAG: hypothetical protein NC235_12460 [Clostridiales bacterium]|nr:hypothetical protein [Clostridiales bacterium]
MAEALAAATKALMKRLAVDLALDKDKRNKILLIVGSIVVGLIFLLMTPVVVLSSIGGIKPSTVEFEFNESDFLNNMDEESLEKLEIMQAQGQAIEDAMISENIGNQTIKAQLIYFSFFDNVSNFDVQTYVNLFNNNPEDTALIRAINAEYGLEINYEDFMRTYTFVMNTTIDPHMFTDSGTKNCADLAAWAENAYTSGWGFQESSYGEIDENLRYRCSDNVGLIMGDLRYMPSEKSFNMDVDTLIYNEIGELDTMPDIAGIGLFDGNNFGVYVGNGNVIFASYDVESIVKSPVTEGNWISWCTFEGINYPQEVTDRIEEIQNPTEENTEEENENGE